MADMIYVRQKQPLGLGHAILSAKEAVGDEPFAVLLGDDVIYDLQKPTLARMLEIYERYNRPVIAIREVAREQVVRYGIVGGKVLGGGVVEISSMVEKPSVDVAPSNWAIIGRYVLPPETFDYIEETKMGPTGEIHLTDALSRLLHDGPVYGYLFPGTYLDCGEKLGYLKAMIYYSMLREDLASALREFMREFLK